MRRRQDSLGQPSNSRIAGSFRSGSAGSTESGGAGQARQTQRSDPAPVGSAAIYASPNLLSSSALPPAPLPPGVGGAQLPPSSAYSQPGGGLWRGGSAGSSSRLDPFAPTSSLQPESPWAEQQQGSDSGIADIHPKYKAVLDGPNSFKSGMTIRHKEPDPAVRVPPLRRGGWLHAVDDGRAVSGLPCRTGTEIPLPSAPLPASCCVPPGWDEPLLEPDRNLVQDMMLHDARRLSDPLDVINEVVYDAVDASPYHSRMLDDMASPPDAAAEGRRLPYYVSADPETDTTLVFESRFESGNLRRAVQVYEYEYDLVLRPDINTKGHTQWFYFSVANTRRARKVKFNIINLMKEDSLYGEGMQPLVHSAKEAAAAGTGWHRTGELVTYYQNNIKRKNGRYFYTLTFTLSFQHDDDVVHVAHCYPYTYSDLQRYLDAMSGDPRMKHRMRRRTLCQTLAGNACDLVTVTNFAEDSPEAMGKRKGVVITARVHPGETNASWMMKGVLDFITGNSLDAKLLRSKFVFKVVPMLNPDGVINGNYRCSLAGVDLNRTWLEPSRKLHPTIHSTKSMIKKLMEDREVVLFCDLHGHSRKKNIFLYGCEKKGKDLGAPYPGALLPGSMGAYPATPQRLQEKLFPCMLHHNLPNIFSFGSSNFKVQKSKESTARVVGWRELGLVNSFTLEASFAGASTGKYAGLHFTTGHLEEMGHAVCQTLLDYISPDNTFASDVLRELDVMARSGGGMVDSLVDEDDPPTDSEDDEDEDEDGKGKGAEAEAVPAPAGADSKVKRSAGKKRGGKGRAMRELEMLSKQGEAASQLLMQDALQFFQNRFGMDSTQAPGFLQESGATGLAYTHDSSAPNLLPRKAQGGASGLPPSAPSGQDRRRS